MESETIEFSTTDGTTLTGDVIVPAEPRGAAVVCHPHPRFGGNRFNPVVDALFTALARSGIAALRFDFRAEFDDGRGELLDLEAALAELRRAAPGVATFATGYSFGAMIALALALDDDAISGTVVIAPPLGHTRDAESVVPRTPCLVMTPAHDQFAPPDVAEPIVRMWPDADFEIVESVDHFLTGRASAVADRAVVWVEQRLAQLSD